MLLKDITIDGFLLGSNINLYTEKLEGFKCIKHEFCNTYESKDLKIWVNDSIISQLMIQNDNKWKLFEIISIGDTLEDVENLLGNVIEDEEDNLILKDVPNVFFDVIYDDKEKNKKKFKISCIGINLEY